MIKLLRDETVQVDVKKRLKTSVEGKLVDGKEVHLKFAVLCINSALQARLLDMSRMVFTQEGKQRYIACQLNNCIADDQLEINGKIMSASQLAEMADFADLTTAALLALVSMEIDKTIFASGEEEKK